MFALPPALIGVLLELLVGGSPLNMFSMIGSIMLMGLVIKYATLLVDNANQHTRAGLNLFDALLEAGTTRFRPIIMTTLALLFGMLPLALNIHEGSGQIAPMAHAMIGGLISSTLLTPVVVPVVLTYIDSFGKWASQMSPSAPDDHDPSPQIGENVRPLTGSPAEQIDRRHRLATDANTVPPSDFSVAVPGDATGPDRPYPPETERRNRIRLIPRNTAPSRKVHRNAGQTMARSAPR